MKSAVAKCAGFEFASESALGGHLFCSVRVCDNVPTKGSVILCKRAAGALICLHCRSQFDRDGLVSTSEICHRFVHSLYHLAGLYCQAGVVQKKIAKKLLDEHEVPQLCDSVWAGRASWLGGPKLYSRSAGKIHPISAKIFWLTANFLNFCGQERPTV